MLLNGIIVQPASIYPATSAVCEAQHWLRPLRWCALTYCVLMCLSQCMSKYETSYWRRWWWRPWRRPERWCLGPLILQDESPSCPGPPCPGPPAHLDNWNQANQQLKTLGGYFIGWFQYFLYSMYINSTTFRPLHGQIIPNFLCERGLMTKVFLISCLRPWVGQAIFCCCLFFTWFWSITTW